MKTRILPLIPLLLMFALSLFGQDYAFKVLANKGSNELKSDGSWQPLKTGAILKSSDELKLVENGYVGLVHVSGKPVELKKPDTYDVSKLSSEVSGGASVLVKYTDFILSNNSAEAKKNRLSATGAVHRAVETSAIRLMLPPNQNSGIYNTVAVINWDGSKVKGPYVVTFRNMYDDVLYHLETPETTLSVNFTEGKLASQTAILIEVSAKDDPELISEQHLIKKLTPAKQEEVTTMLDEIAEEVSGETPLNKLILAGFYEENDLLIDATAAYEGAVKLAPDVPAFKDAYNEFLLRHALAY
jgi:hypothetical protein